jgi:hypothetical protein
MGGARHDKAGQNGGRCYYSHVSPPAAAISIPGISRGRIAVDFEIESRMFGGRGEIAETTRVQPKIQPQISRTLAISASVATSSASNWL